MTAPRSDSSPDSPGPSTRTVVRLAGGGVALLLLVLFVVQNDARVRLQFLAWDMTTRLAWAMLLSAALGFLIGLVAPRLWRLLRGRQGRERA